MTISSRSLQDTTPVLKLNWFSRTSSHVCDVLASLICHDLACLWCWQRLTGWHLWCTQMTVLKLSMSLCHCSHDMDKCQFTDFSQLMFGWEININSASKTNKIVFTLLSSFTTTPTVHCWILLSTEVATIVTKKNLWNQNCLVTWNHTWVTWHKIWHKQVTWH